MARASTILASIAVLVMVVSCAEGNDSDSGGGDDDDDGSSGRPSSRLSLLVLSSPAEALTPEFDPEILSYDAAVGRFASEVTVTAVAEDAEATVAIAGGAAGSGASASTISLVAGTNPVAIVVSDVNGDSTTYDVHVTRAAALQSPPLYVKASNTGSADGFGQRIAFSGDTLAVSAPSEESGASGVGGNQADNSAPAAGAVYVFRRSGGGWAQEAYLKASNAALNDRFGEALALDGDTLVAGAPGESSSATGVGGNQANDDATSSGAAYVFVRNEGIWSQQAYLKASNAGAGDLFGSTVSISGDTLVVGAPNESSNAIGVNGDSSNNAASVAGAAYVFVRGGGVWTQQSYLKASNTAVGDLFGTSVAVSGDTIVVGATGEDSAYSGVNTVQNNEDQPQSGAAYVFTRSGAAWSQQAYVKPSNTGLNDNFGSAVAIDGDTVAIAAQNEDGGAPGVNGPDNNDAGNSGAAYVFTRTGTTWSQQAYVKASNPENSDYFGFGLAVSGDALAVGAYGEDSSSTGIGGDKLNTGGDGGAVYLFTRSAGTWSQQAYLKASNTGIGDNFGTSVAMSGDVIAIGAPGEDSAATGVGGDAGDDSVSASGAAYLYR